MRQITYRDALREALDQEMEQNPDVFVYGISAPDHKRIFGTTAGLLEKFGPMRCFDTPICEDTMTGFGLGAAVGGLRPVHVHIRVDFLLLAMNQLANMVSSFRYSCAGTLKVPLVIRAIIGRGWGQSFQHSKTMHSCFAHIPGLKVVMPTTAYDAKGMLISAIRDDNPVIVMEHRWLYWQEGDVPSKPYTVPIGPANVLRKGKDVTVVAASWMNVEALRAAQILEKHGVSIEIVDARTIAPFEKDIIIQSVEKTRRCIVVDNDWLHCGFSAEVAAQVSKDCFSKLKCPVERLGFAATHCPTARHLENAFYPGTATIVREAEKMLKLKPLDLSGEELYSYENKFKGPF